MGTLTGGSCRRPPRPQDPRGPALTFLLSVGGWADTGDFQTFPGKNYFFFRWCWARPPEILSRLVILEHSKENLQPEVIHRGGARPAWRHQAARDILVLLVARGEGCPGHGVRVQSLPAPGGAGTPSWGAPEPSEAVTGGHGRPMSSRGTCAPRSVGLHRGRRRCRPFWLTDGVGPDPPGWGAQEFAPGVGSRGAGSSCGLWEGRVCSS